ncbi:MAG: hypothetical protein Q8P02_04920, partial [Candidatus Micrarchaeota archaeon]|nr:hypothetical protein [Candidatus Micrarchaeota archaeon]
MKLQFKPLLFILPVFILLFGGFGFHGFLFDWYPDFEHPLPVALHLNGEELLGLNVLRESQYGVRGYFLVVLFFTGILLQALVVPLIERLFKKTAQQA